jgi:hypothetical protein
MDSAEVIAKLVSEIDRPVMKSWQPRELRDSGVTESVIYPDLDGLGREMKQLWEELK